MSRSYVRCVDQGEFCPAENLWCELAAVPVGGGPTGGWREACRAWPGFEATRRAKLVGMEAAVPVGGGRARAGLEIDHSEP